MIKNVEIKELVSHGDDRGFFREIIRVTDDLFFEGGFGQWSHSKMQVDAVKAWHYHHVQYDWWYVPLGTLQTVLFDNREESPTYKEKMVIMMGEEEHGGKPLCVKIPPGVLHGCRALVPSHLFYITSHTYDPHEEGRFPYNWAGVGHDWGENPIVAENDKREFVPTSTRALIS